MPHESRVDSTKDRGKRGESQGAHTALCVCRCVSVWRKIKYKIKATANNKLQINWSLFTEVTNHKVSAATPAPTRRTKWCEVKSRRLKEIVCSVFFFCFSWSVCVFFPSPVWRFGTSTYDDERSNKKSTHKNHSEAGTGAYMGVHKRSPQQPLSKRDDEMSPGAPKGVKHLGPPALFSPVVLLFICSLSCFVKPFSLLLVVMNISFFFLRSDN